MNLAIDTDAFCKLGGPGLLLPFLDSLGVSVPECSRLARLPYQLLGAPWLRTLREDVRAELLEIAQAMRVAVPRPGGWHDRLLDVDAEIDAGEAALLALAADGDVGMVLTGDKRAVRAAGRIDLLLPLLLGRIVVVEQAASRAIDHLGEPAVAALLAERADCTFDVVFASCLRSADRLRALDQYTRALDVDLPAGLLWVPDKEGDH